MSNIEGYKELREKLARFRGAIQKRSQDFILRLMKKQIDMILARTRDGETIDGGAFKPYSPAYAKRKRKMVADYPSWLRVSGKMLNSMVVRLIRANTGEVLFGNARSRELMGYNDRTRPFFGVNKAEENTLVKYYSRLMLQEVKSVFG